MKRISQCNHENVEVVMPYGAGFIDRENGITVMETHRCKDCGWTWNETHRGNYVQVTPSVKVDNEEKAEESIKFTVV